jgi:hypothetical protein
VTVSHRLSRLRAHYPHLLPLEATKDRDSLLSMDFRTIFREIFTNVISEEMDILLRAYQ